MKRRTLIIGNNESASLTLKDELVHRTIDEMSNSIEWWENYYWNSYPKFNINILLEVLLVSTEQYTFVTIMSRNDELSWTMSWVGCLLTDKVLPDKWKLREWE